MNFLPSKNGIRYGTSTPPPILEQSNDTVPFIRATDIKNGEILTDTLLHIEKNQPQKMQKCLLKEGEMIVVRSGVNTGDCATVPKSLAGSYGAYDLIVEFSNDVIPSFISTFLDTNIGRLQLNLLKGRSAQSHLNAEEISSIIIPKPPIEIQKSLVAEIEAARQSRKQKLAQAEELLSSIDSYLLNELGLTPPKQDNKKVFATKIDRIKNRIDPHFYQPKFKKLIQLLTSHHFPVSTLGAVSIDIFSGITPKSGGEAYTNEIDGIPFIRSGEITKDGDIAIEQSIFIKEEVHENLMFRSQLQQDDLLIAIVGATIGSVGIYNHSQPANINQAIAAVRLDQNKILPKFARYLLYSSIGQMILDRIKRPVARANINLEEISNIIILIPPLELQNSIINEIEEIKLERIKLRQEAELEWEMAKTRFEQKLLGEQT